MEKRDLKFSATYTSINKYVDQLYDGFIASVVGKVRTLDFITIVPDVKYSKVVPTVDTTLDFVAADTCTTFANGATTSVVGVTLTACYLKSEESFCLNEMEQYYFGQYMRRGSTQEQLPFEEAFMDEKMGKIAKKLDQIFWQGNSCVTGLIAGATAGGASLVTASFSVSTAANNGVIATFDAMADALNSDMLSEELVLFCGQDTFDKYTRSIRNLNLYHFSPDEINGASVRMFGKRNITIVATVGLDGTNRAILTKPEFILWGTDLAPADEALAGEYNFQLDRYLMRYKVKIAAGIAFPARAVVAR
ncbi:MAG: hypothetical protein ACK6D3_07225 [Planctomycetaceae bacterium]